MALTQSNGVLWTSYYGQLQQSRDAGRSFASEAAWGYDFESQAFNVSQEGWGLRLFYTRDPQSNQRQAAQLWAREGLQGSWLQRAMPALPDTYYPWFHVRDSLIGAAGAWLIIQTSDASDPQVWRSEDKLQSWRTVPAPQALNALGQTAATLSGDEAPGVLTRGLLDAASMWLQSAGKSAAGRSLRITNDGGRTWSDNRHPFKGESNYIDALRRDVTGALLLAQSGGSRWFRSTDEGRQWRALPLALPADGFESIDQLLMLDRDHGLAISNWGQLLQTRDGGRQWTSSPSDAALRPWQVLLRYTSALDEARAQLSLGADGRVWLAWLGQLFRSADRGRSWQAVPLALGPEAAGQRLEARRLLWHDGGRIVLDLWEACRRGGGGWAGWAPVCTAGLAVSDDDGRTWQLRSTLWDEFSLLTFLSPSEGLRTFCGNVYRTQDAGLCWQRVVGSTDLLRYPQP